MPLTSLHSGLIASEALTLPVVELWRGFGVAIAFGLLVGIVVALVNGWKA